MKYFFVGALIVLCLFPLTADRAFSLSQGFLDLSQYNFEVDGPLEITGECEYQFNDRGDIQNRTRGESFNIPGYWNQKENTGEGFCVIKFALSVKNEKPLYLFQDYCSTTYELYVNDRLLLHCGRFGTDASTSIPELNTNIVKLPESPRLNLVYKISNFHSNKGGMPYPPVIGTENQIKAKYFYRIFFDSVLTGILYILAIYHLFMWMLNRKNRAAVIAGLSCLSFGLRIITANFLLGHFFSTPSVLLYELQLKITYFFGCYGWVLISFFLNAVFGYKLNRKILRILKWVQLLFLLFIIFSPASFFNSLLIPFQIIILLFGLWNILTILYAISQKREYAVTLLTGMLVLLLTIINDILYANSMLFTYNFFAFGLTFFMVCEALIIAKQSAQAYKQSVYLTRNLQQEVTNQTAELIQANRKIEEQSRQKTDYFVKLAHETKTPLTLITNYLDHYMKKHAVDQDLAIIKQNIEKLRRDMVNFLDTEKILHNQILYNHDQICPLSDLVMQKCELFGPSALSKKILFEHDIAETVYIKADPVAVDRIMNNLLDNALKYTEENSHIKIVLRQVDDQVRLMVSDTGTGIPEDQIDHIFEPYYQLSHKKSKNQGLGMGLNITRNIVLALGGEIEVNSQSGRGTEFTLLFKSCKMEEDSASPDFRLKEPTPSIMLEQGDIAIKEWNKKKKTVFLVEDNLQLVAYLNQELENDYNFQFGLNGKDALAKLNPSRRPDIIISDIMMDEMDGYEFRENISAKKEYRAIPFIFLTAKGGADACLKGIHQGAVDYICKPFNIAELKGKIQAWISLCAWKDSPEEIERKHIIRLSNFVKEYGITQRQREVLHWLLQSYENKDIAEEMCITTNTVKVHINKIKESLGVATKKELLLVLYKYIYK